MSIEEKNELGVVLERHIRRPLLRFFEENGSKEQPYQGNSHFSRYRFASNEKGFLR